MSAKVMKSGKYPKMIESYVEVYPETDELLDIAFDREIPSKLITDAIESGAKLYGSEGNIPKEIRTRIILGAIKDSGVGFKKVNLVSKRGKDSVFYKLMKEIFYGDKYNTNRT